MGLRPEQMDGAQCFSCRLSGPAFADLQVATTFNLERYAPVDPSALL